MVLPSFFCCVDVGVIFLFENLNGIVETAVIVPAGRPLGTINILDRYHQPLALNGRAKIADKFVRPAIVAALPVGCRAVCMGEPFIRGVSDNHRLLVGQVHNSNGTRYRDKSGRSRFDLAGFKVYLV